MSNGTTNDFVLFGITDTSTWSTVFKSPYPGLTDALNGTSTSINVPAGVLLAGHQYDALLVFVKFVSTDNSAYPGVTLIGAGYIAETDVDFTAGTPSPVVLSL